MTTTVPAGIYEAAAGSGDGTHTIQRPEDRDGRASGGGSVRTDAGADGGATGSRPNFDLVQVQVPGAIVGDERQAADPRTRAFWIRSWDLDAGKNGRRASAHVSCEAPDSRGA